MSVLGKNKTEQRYEGKRLARRKKGFSVKIGVVLLLTFLVLVNLFAQFYSVVRYYGDSMRPSLRNGQVLFVRKTQEVEEGDVVAFYYNNKILIRRVISMGGDSITIDSSGNVFIDGEELEEPYVENRSIGQCDLDFPYDVPVGQIFLMGDDRVISMDSRLSQIGTISADRLLGKVVFHL